MMLINVKRLADPTYRRELIAKFLAKAAHTQPDALPYPADWAEPAASPPAFQALAEATQTALLRRAVKTSHASIIGDWDQAVEGNVCYWSDGGAANRPDDSILGPSGDPVSRCFWMGYVAALQSPDDLVQLVWPFAYSGAVDATIAYTRMRSAGVWRDWHRQTDQHVGRQIDDWNDATAGGGTSWWSLPDAANRPSQVINAHWLGIVVVHNPDWLLQLVWPFAGGAFGISSTMQWARVRTPQGWTNWARQANFVHSYGLVDGFVDFRHADVTRFKVGLKYGGTGGEPSPGDQYRVQCYDPAGQFTHTAMTINQNGVVSFPKGHALTQVAREQGDPVPANQAATHGDVAAMLIIALRAYSAGRDPEPLIQRLIAGDDA